MDNERLKTGIADLVCSRFMTRKSTLRHTILVQFEAPDVLDEMATHGFISAADQRENYLPTAGSFAILGDEHELYQSARLAFERTVYALWGLFRSEGCGVDHEIQEFTTYANTL